jgi:glycosyltransferase involved in cell wall biosynthesis
VRRSAGITVDVIVSHLRRADIAIFHEFLPPPYGGGNQFLLGLKSEFEKLGYRIEKNSISPSTRACLYNSFNFDFDRLKRFARSGCRMVHRVDGPIAAYRGWDDGTDARIRQINDDLAHATIFQSRYSLEKHLELGMTFKSPTVIHNAPDPAIFNLIGRIPFHRDRKTRLISTSWSDNPNKGADFYKRLEQRLDWRKYEYTFVGRSKIRFDHIRMMEPLASGQLADLLRQQDIFITASRNDPCSNSVVEALACGLPCLALRSGGHPELVGQGGFAFSSEQEALELLERLVDEYEARQAKISVLSLREVALRYLVAMGVTIEADS